MPLRKPLARRRGATAISTCISRHMSPTRPHASYSIGKPDRRKLNGARLWQQFGPTAPKEYAAVLYHNHKKGPSERWKWAQGPHKLALPPLLDHHAVRGLSRPDPLDANCEIPNLSIEAPSGREKKNETGVGTRENCANLTPAHGKNEMRERCARQIAPTGDSSR